MPGIFEQIKGLSTEPEKKAPAPSKPAQDDIVFVITEWQQNRTPQGTRQILQYLKPTIDSALHSYTPGQEDSFRLKAASIALQSLRNYDSKSKASPKTFVFSNLQRLNRLRRQRQNMVHIPQNQVYQTQYIQSKTRELQDDLGRQPTDQELSEALHISQKKLDKFRQQAQIYLSQSMSQDAQGHELLGATDVTDKDYYNYVYSSVSPIDKKIMEWTTGYTGKPLSNNQIAQKLHLSPGAVSQRKKRLQQLMGEVRGLV